MTAPAVSHPQDRAHLRCSHHGVRVIFISEDSLVLPILFSQGLPHLTRLAKRGYRIWILSFEGANVYYRRQRDLYERTRNELRAAGIRTVAPPPLALRLAPTMLAKLGLGSFYAMVLTVAYRPRVIHARSFFPALIGLLCKRVIGCRLIYDMRSPFVDEQVSLGRLRLGTWPYRLAQWLDRRLLEASDAIVAVSEPFADLVESRLAALPRRRSQRVDVIPNCVDPERFRLRPEVRRERRRALGLGDRTVLVAAMSWLSQRYAVPEMVGFFVELKRLDPSAALLILANRPSEDEIIEQVHGLGVEQKDFRAVNASPDEVAAYMQAGDAGIFFGGKGFNQRIVFPIKFAEYLACGMPVVINRDVTFLCRLLEGEGVGVSVDMGTPAGLRQGARSLVRLLGEDRDLLRARCRKVAVERFSVDVAVDAYDRIYRRLTAR